MQVDLVWRLVLGGQTNSQVSSQAHASCQNKTFQDRLSSFSLANNRLKDVTQLTLTWVGWPNGETLALTCVQVIAIQRKCMQPLAKWSRK